MRRRVTHSLRARLLLLLFSAVVLTAGIQAFVAYRTSLDETNEIFDYQMEQMALSLRQGLAGAGYGSYGFRQDQDESFEFIVQVTSADRNVLFQSSDGIPLPPREASGFSLFEARGTTYKLYSLRQGNQLIQVAQDRAARRRLARNLAFRTTMPIVVMVLLLLFLVWWVVTWSLEPVHRVQRQLATRAADAPDAVDSGDLPSEVRPLVDELNRLLHRMHDAFAAQKNFVADAAHELRSPLSALKLQVEQLRRAGATAEREVAIQRLGNGIERATRLVEQLLVLARQQAHPAVLLQAQPIEANRLCLQAFTDVYPAALARQIDMGLLQARECFVLGQEEALRIMLRNILENAVRHAPAGSKVDMQVRPEGGEVELVVEDSGPGIPGPHLERVMDRFYRIPGTAAPGSGLGLSIVKTIADLHGARITIGPSAALGGLRVGVRFGAVPPPPAPTPTRTA